jgi:hypothetical protein
MASVTFSIGTNNWQAPTDVTSIQIECWGPGGSSRHMSGGGGGAYAKTNSVTVVPGNVYQFYVGQTFPTYSKDSYSFDNYCRACGGLPSTILNASSKSNPGEGGNAESCIGDVKVSGGKGGCSGYLYTGGGGGCAGDNGDSTTGGSGGYEGGDGGNGSSTISNNGGFPGGGASGTVEEGGLVSGGQGQIRITYA